MTQITRYDGNLKPFADDALGTERTVFGDTAQDNTLDANINTDFFRGWGIVDVNDLPTKQDFNAFAYTSTALTSYLFQVGIAEWNTNQDFYAKAITNREGLLYKATADTTGDDPNGDDGSNWIELLGITEYDSGTEYNANSIVRKRGTYEIYGSIANGNVGNALPSAVTDANWTYLTDFSGAAFDFATAQEVREGASGKVIQPSDLLTALGVTDYYNIDGQAWSNGGTLTLAHGLERKPKLWFFRFTCTTAQHGYSIGSTIDVFGTNSGTNSALQWGTIVDADATDLYVRIGTTGIAIPHKTTGARSTLTAGSWELEISAWG